MTHRAGITVWWSLAALCAVLLLSTGCTRIEMPWSSDPAAPLAPQPVTQVTISARGFEPRETQVLAGDTVVWVNTGPEHHRPTGAGGIASHTLGLSESYRRTFDSPGTYPYTCEIHPSEKGTVVVSPR